ncbi:MAG: biotin/lipoyl-binding protein [Coriobacteriia bacterium]|nr:biotin/lipoyl-binding protein [Coriobacteriia bacterium]
MKRPWFIPLVIVALLAGLSWLASSRVSANDPAVTGVLQAGATVRTDPVLVLAPSIATTRTASVSGQPAVAGTLTSVTVSAGDRVSAGQVIARLDDRALVLRVQMAQAAARGARARVGVIDANLDTLANNSATLASARRKLDAALPKLKASRVEVVSNLAKARAAASQLPPGWKAPPGMPDPRVLVAKLEGALAQIDAGMAKATSGRAKLYSGAAKIADARSQLRDARRILVLAADAADIGVQVAEARRDLAVIRTPRGGTVTWAAEAGTVVFGGGPIARILPDGPIVLDTYIDAGQAKIVRVGSAVSASSDSHPAAAFTGHVTAVFPVYDYPPTSLPTTLIHMTRAFKVSVTLDDTAAPLPPGTPADLTISTRSGS